MIVARPSSTTHQSPNPLDVAQSQGHYQGRWQLRTERRPPSWEEINEQISQFDQMESIVQELMKKSLPVESHPVKKESYASVARRKPFV